MQICLFILIYIPETVEYLGPGRFCADMLGYAFPGFFCPLFPRLLLTLRHPICEVFQWFKGCSVLLVAGKICHSCLLFSPEAEGHFDRGMGKSLSDISDKIAKYFWCDELI